MAKIKVEVEHCWECQCKYLKRECGYSPDPFEGRYEFGTCKHPNAPEYSYLGEHMYIPKWCPLLIDDENDEWKNQLIDAIKGIS